MNNSLTELTASMRAGALTARACCERHLDRIRAREAVIQAWETLEESRALSLAEACDAVRHSGVAPGPLLGIPIGVKDIFDTDDLPTQMGSPIFSGNRPRKNAAAVERLLAAGAYVLGKTVTTECAFLHPGKTRNPWNPAHTPGGSSSGSAAAVAAGFVPGAIGSQTNGSVIRPAAFCGVVGFKPGYEVIPYAGALQFSVTFDHVGVFARSVADAATLAAPLAGAGALSAAVGALSCAPRIAVLPQFPWNRAEPEAAAQLRATLGCLAAAGAQIAELSLPDTLREAHRVHRTIMFCEGAREHGARQKQQREKMSATLNAALDEGARTTDDEYARALAQRAEAIGRASDLFGNCDAVASLPAPGAAPAGLGATGDPSFCTLWSLTGFPSITIPSGVSQAGLPFGLQLAAPGGADDGLLRVAAWCEAVVGFDRTPM